MAVQATNAYGWGYFGTGVDPAARAGTGSQEVDKLAFLRLIVAQLKNQNPLDPMDNSQFLTQLAQFRTLEQMQGMARDARFGHALGLLGRRVVVKDPEGAAGGATLTGAVVGFRMQEGGEPLVRVLDEAGTRTVEVAVEDVREVAP